MTKSNIQVSFIVLCFNEEKNINKTIEEIFKTSKVCDLKNFEIIVIDDGSFDNSYNIVKKHKSIKKFKNKINLGMGGAYKEGLKKSKGEYIIMIPGDNSHPVSSIKPIIERKGTTDMIIPYTDKKGNRNFFRYILSKLFTGLVNYIFKLNLNYYNGTVLHKKKILDKIEIHTNGFDYQAEILIKLINMGYLFEQIPVSITERIEGKSKAVSISNSIKIVQNLYSLKKQHMKNLF